MQTYSFLGCLIGILLSLPFVVSFQQPSKLHQPKTVVSPSSIIKHNTITRLAQRNPNSIDMATEELPPPEEASFMNTALTTIGSTTSAVVAGTFYAVLAYLNEML